MGGQVLGGGVLIAVATLLCLVYLMPSLIDRMRYNAAERNATRLSQALRVLAETSETPREVTLELRAREARRQQRLVRRLRDEEERARRAEHDSELAFAKERADAEVASAKTRAAAKAEQAKLDDELQREHERAQRAVELEQRKAEILAAKLSPAAVRRRQARARVIVRLLTVLLFAAGIAAVVCALSLPSIVAPVPVALVGVGAAFGASLVLRRLAVVARRRVRAGAVPAVAAARAHDAAEQPQMVSDLIDPVDRGWTPRKLPTPMTAVTGSRAAAVQAESASHALLARAARDEAMRQLAAERQPVALPLATGAAPPSDAAIEAHVREMLQRRAAG